MKKVKRIAITLLMTVAITLSFAAPTSVYADAMGCAFKNPEVREIVPPIADPPPGNGNRINGIITNPYQIFP